MEPGAIATTPPTSLAQTVPLDTPIQQAEAQFYGRDYPNAEVTIKPPCANWRCSNDEGSVPRPSNWSAFVLVGEAGT
jgi:hypothetical protein